MLIAVVGAHLSGQPLNGQLTERGGTLVRTTKTAPVYRFFALASTKPAKPGLVRVAESTGTGIEVEVWDLAPAAFASFMELVPGPLCIGTLQLEDGTGVKGFLVESIATAGATDITHFGGWRAYLKSLAP